MGRYELHLYFLLVGNIPQMEIMQFASEMSAGEIIVGCSTVITSSSVMPMQTIEIFSASGQGACTRRVRPPEDVKFL